MNETIEIPRKRPPAVTLERVLLSSILVLQAAILVSLHTSASGGRMASPAPAAPSRTAPAADAPQWNSVSNAAVGLSAPHAAVPRDDIFARPHTIDSLLERAMADFERMERLINLDEGTMLAGIEKVAESEVDDALGGDLNESTGEPGPDVAPD